MNEQYRFVLTWVTW